MKKLLILMSVIISTLVGAAQNTPTFKSVDNVEFARTIARHGVQLIDVRTPSEYAAGHIKGARNIDINSTNFDKQTATLDKSRPVAVYCRSGARSKKAAKKLTASGYRVVELDNGINGWNGGVVK